MTASNQHRASWLASTAATTLRLGRFPGFVAKLLA